MLITALALATALAGLKPGATVTLGPGPYDLIEIKNATFDPPVTINAGTTLVHGLRIWDSSGIIWRGGTIVAPAGRDGSGPTVYGADVRRSRNLTFDGTTVSEALRGIVVADSDRLVVRKVHFTALRSDGIDIAGTSNVVLEDNRFDTFAPFKGSGSKAEGNFVGGDHPDAIQIWTTPTNRRVADIAIHGNVVDGDLQGINFFGPVGDGYTRVTVEKNEVRVTYPAGISVISCTGCNVQSNRVSARPESRYKANIRFDYSTGKLCGNVVSSIPNHPASKSC